jgi:hypothetical protein
MHLLLCVAVKHAPFPGLTGAAFLVLVPVAILQNVAMDIASKTYANAFLVEVPATPVPLPVAMEHAPAMEGFALRSSRNCLPQLEVLVSNLQVKSI